MTLLTTVQDVCPFIGVDVPTSIFTGLSSERTQQELLALANEMARRIVSDTRDWQRLRFQAVFTGDAVNVADPGEPPLWVGTTAFDLPADYLRIPISSNMWSSTQTQRPMRFIPDTDEWMQRRAAGNLESCGEWTILGGQVHIEPVMHAAVPEVPGVSPAVPVQTARIVYYGKNGIRYPSVPTPTFGERFLSDNDSFVLDERLLKLGMIWQWKAHKGSPYAEDMGTYTDALMLAMGFDSPAPILMGNLPVSAQPRVAFPWPVPT